VAEFEWDPKKAEANPLELTAPFESIRFKHLWQICGRIGGKTEFLGHQWNKRAERNACISAENFAGLCIACIVR
jgi:hypothetical protein